MDVAGKCCFPGSGFPLDQNGGIEIRDPRYGLIDISHGFIRNHQIIKRRGSRRRWQLRLRPGRILCRKGMDLFDITRFFIIKTSCENRYGQFQAGSIVKADRARFGLVFSDALRKQ